MRESGSELLSRSNQGLLRRKQSLTPPIELDFRDKAAVNNFADLIENLLVGRNDLAL